MNGIDESHFIPTILPKEKIAYMKMLERFDWKLLLILKDEVKQGNRILSVSENLSEEAMVVILSQPFKKKYDYGLEFGSSTNPHDGGDYYSTAHSAPYTLIAPLK
jgi:hypothetical protein